MVLTQDRRIFIVEHYLAEKLKKKGFKLYASEFVDTPTLNRKNISRLVNKFCQTGTVNNLPCHSTHTALTPETLATVSSALS